MQISSWINQVINYSERIKYFVAPLLFFIIINSELAVDHKAKLFFAIFSMVISLWLLTPIPLFISGLLGVCLSVLFGVVTAGEAFAPFANPVIFLFLGGFLIARALEKTKLDQRIAAEFLAHPWVSVSAKRNVLVFLGLSFILSMWISNTAAVAMLLPISYGVIKKLEENYGIKDEKFNEKLLIALAFSATVGGNVTPIGSPPNAIALGLLEKLTGNQISFLEWMLLATPISLILFFVIYKRCVSHLPESKPLIKDATEDLSFSHYTKKQKYVMFIFFLAVTLWVVPSIIGLFLSENDELYTFLTTNLSASIVSMFCASLLFLIPFDNKEKILESNDISQIDWSSLLLFGAGLSLGTILFKTGGAQYLMDLIKDVSSFMGPMMIIAILLMFTIFFTEIASNTATANIILPVVIAFGIEFDLSTTSLALCFALACSCAFMLPVATPPNAIVYGSKRVSKIAMIKSGLTLNLIGLVILIFMSMLLNWN